MATLNAQSIVSNINPTEGFVSYVGDIKPYHTKVLEVLIEYIYTEKIGVTVTEGDNWVIDLTRPDVGVYTTCGFGTQWDSLLVADYPIATIVQAVGDVTIPVHPLIDPGFPNVLTIANDPTNYTLVVNDPITFRTTGTLPTTTVGNISPGLVYYVLSNTGTQLTIAKSIGGTPLTFVTAGTGHITVHPEHLPYNTFLVDQPTPMQFQCIVANEQANQFAFVTAYNIVGVNTGARTWTAAGQLMFSAYQDISFSITKLITDSTNILNDATLHNLTIKIDGVNYPISVAGSAIQTISALVGVINTAISGHGTATFINDVIRVTSNSVGYNSSVSITDVNLLSSMIDFSGVALSVNNTVVIPGNYIYVRNNTGAGANTQFTIVSGTYTGGNTTITVLEPISVQAQSNGIMNIQDDITLVPDWFYGTAIQLGVSGSNVLPSPLNNSTTYYFIPSDVSSIFNLSSQPYPAEFRDIVDVTNLGTGMINIFRTQVFYPGASVAVSGTYNSDNNGAYHVNKVVPEGNYLRVYTYQKVNRYTPPSLFNANIPDGTMRLDNHVGYDYPNFCALVEAPDLYTSAFIDDRISFEVKMVFKDNVASIIFEDNADIPSGTEYTAITAYGAGIVPVGYDMQYFDIGPYDEDLSAITHYLP